jgi:UDP-glucose 4-epimerase
MNIIITGGHGFLGSNLARELNKRGHKITILDKKRTINNYNLSFSKKIKTYNVDISSKKSLNKIKIKEKSLLIHCAAQPSAAKSFEIPELDLQTNIVGTFNLLNWSKKNKIQKIVYASTFNVYEENNKQFYLNEDYKCNPKSLYATSKLTAENYIRVYCKFLGIKWNIIRMFNIYGPGQDPNNKFLGMINIFLNMAKKEPKIVVKGSLKRFRDFVFINDVIRAWILVVEDKKHFNEIYNVGSGKKTSIKELLNQISLTIKKKLTVEEQQGTPGDFMGCVADIKKIKRDLGFKPLINLSKGLKIFNKWIENLN